MSLKNLSVIFFAMATFVWVKSFEDPFNTCAGRKHVITGAFGFNCCKNQSVNTGIGTLAQWKECATDSIDSNETYIETEWRIYICMLRNIVPKGQEKISLVEFGKAMTIDYPEGIKNDINKAVKEDKTEANFKDIENINQLRAKYFNIEKKACGVTKDVTKTDKELMSCSQHEEYLHRGGICCKNVSLPFLENDYIDLSPQDCNNTLTKLKGKLDMINSTDRIIFMSECKYSCHLIQKGILTVEDLMKLKPSDEILSKEVVDGFMPKYHSKQTQKIILDRLTNRITPTTVADLFASQHKRNISEEIYGCSAHKYTFQFTFAHLLDICKDVNSGDLSKISNLM